MEDQRKSRGWPFLAALGCPAFGIALAYTVVTTYMPLLIERVSGPAMTGVIVGGEGVLSLILPVLVGTWSDSVRTSLGSREPFILAGAAMSVVGILLLPLGSGSLVGVACGLAVFFAGYFVYYSPYYALFPDVVPDEERGRSQGVQGTFRSIGMLSSLSLGGLLMHWWEPLPFVVGAVAIVGVTVILHRATRDALPQRSRPAERKRSGRATEWTLLRRDPNIRRWAVANSLWETSVAALRVFVVLYFTRGLGLSLPQVSGALALVGAAAIAAAPISGGLADRFGHRPVMLAALWIFALGLLPPLFTTEVGFIALIVPVAFAAVVLLTLPYSVLMGLLPEEQQHGVGAGLFGFSRGVGVLLGPLLAGLTVQLGQSVGFLTFASTRGYSAMFLVSSIALLASIPVFNGVRTTARG